MISNKPLLILLCLVLSLVNSCYIPIVDDDPEEVIEVDARNDQIVDPAVYGSPQQILESSDPVKDIARFREEGCNFDIIRNSAGLTVLMLAADLRLTNIILALLASGVDTTIRSPQKVNYVGGWYCVDVIPERSAADYARKNGDRRMAAVIDNYKKLMQLYLIRRQLLENPDGEMNLSELPLEVINTITDNMINLLK